MAQKKTKHETAGQSRRLNGQESEEEGSPCNPAADGGVPETLPTDPEPERCCGALPSAPAVKAGGEGGRHTDAERPTEAEREGASLRRYCATSPVIAA